MSLRRPNVIVQAKERAARAVIIAAIRLHKGRLRLVAEELGVRREHMWREMHRYAIVSVERVMAGDETP